MTCVKVPDPDSGRVCGGAGSVRPAEPAGELCHSHEHLLPRILGPSGTHGGHGGPEARPRQAAGRRHGPGGQALVQAGHDAGTSRPVVQRVLRIQIILTLIRIRAPILYFFKQNLSFTFRVWLFPSAYASSCQTEFNIPFYFDEVTII